MFQGFRRVAVPAPAQGGSSLKSFPAPVRGWVSAANLSAAPKLSCLRLENFLPTQTGIKPRGGSGKIATLGDDPVQRVFHYTGAPDALFAADAGNIYDITTVADPDTGVTPVITGQTNGYYSTALFTTSGGTFLTVVNGADTALIFDGTSWFPVGANVTYGLPYNTKTVSFVVGGTVTGGSSSAHGTIKKVIVATSTTGTLWVQSITGVFTNGETITGSGGGSAKANIPSGIQTLMGSITGVATTALSAVWVYKSREYFIEGGTLNAHYLAADSITGALSTLTLFGIFKRGGSLLMGATWSLDAGDGIDDKIVFITDQGEIAIFEGDDPEADNWSLVGRYDITRPLGKNGTMQAGGDLLVLAEDGIVPISAAIKKDQAALSLSAVSRPVEPDWQAEVQARSTEHWEIVKWPSHNLALVTLPRFSTDDPAYSFAVNIETGAWTKITGWDARCADVFEDRLFFGTTDGLVVEGDVGGSDQGMPFTCTMVMHADHLGSMGVTKTVKAARATFVAARPFTPKVSVSTNYTIVLPTPPNAVADIGTVGWDLSVWDDGTWDDPGAVSGPATIASRWTSIGRTGYAVNAQLQITSANVAALDCELVSIDLLYAMPRPGAGVMV